MNLPFLPKISPRSEEQRRLELERQLIKEEAKIGGQLFGPIPEGHTRQFFCLDVHTWIWHEEWHVSNQRHVITTRYTIRPDSVLKSQDGQPNRLASKEEMQNLYRAAKLYEKRLELNYQKSIQQAA